MFSGTTRVLLLCQPAPSRNEEEQQTVRGTVCPTNDGVSARRHSVRIPRKMGDLGEMGVHCGGIDERQDEAGGGAAARANRTEQIGPFISRIAWCPGSGATRRPGPGKCALLADG